MTSETDLLKNSKHDLLTSTSSANLSRQPIVFYDGSCGVCNRFVQFVLRYDRQGVFLFSPLAGETANRYLQAHQPLPDSIVLFQQNALYVKSEAVLRVLRHLSTPISWLRFVRFIPKSWRDAVYDWVARNRLKIGQSLSCRLPTPEEKSRFLP